MTVINPKSISGINSITTGSGGDDLLTIHNNSGAERFRIDGSGNTRITSGIVTTVSVGAVSSVGAISGDVSIADKIVHTGDTDTAIRFPAANTVTVETGGAEALRIDSSGRLNIGNSSNRTVWGGQNALQIEGLNGAAASATIIRNSNDVWYPWLGFGKSRGTSDGSSTIVQDDDILGVISWHGGDGNDMTSQAAAIYCEVDGTPGSNDMPGRLEFHTTADGGETSTERLRINSVGKVGINSTAPDGMLAIEHTSASPNLTMRNHPAAGPYTNEYGLELRHAYGSVKHGALIHTQEADLGRRSLDISDSDGVFCTFVMGRVGINTTRPTGNLDIRAKTDDNPSIRIYRPSGGGDVGSLAFASSQGTNAYINWRGGGGTKGLQFFTSANGNDGSTAERMRLTEHLNILDGNLVIGTSGHGIDFSATSDGPSQGNETLDDYERGTYSPEGLSWNGSAWVNVTFDSISRYGRYTKIGGLVHVQGYLSNFHVDSSFDNTLAGVSLPFTPVNTTGMYSVGVTAHSTAFANAGYTTFFVNATGSAHMYSMQENTTSYNTWSGSSGRYVMFQASYMCE